MDDSIGKRVEELRVKSVEAFKKGNYIDAIHILKNKHYMKGLEMLKNEL